MIPLGRSIATILLAARAPGTARPGAGTRCSRRCTEHPPQVRGAGAGVRRAPTPPKRRPRRRRLIASSQEVRCCWVPAQEHFRWLRALRPSARALWSCPPRAPGTGPRVGWGNAPKHKPNVYQLGFVRAGRHRGVQWQREEEAVPGPLPMAAASDPAPPALPPRSPAVPPCTALGATQQLRCRIFIQLTASPFHSLPAAPPCARIRDFLFIY